MTQNDVLDTAKMEGLVEGEAKGRAEGLVEGEARKNLENARSMKSLGISVDIIHQVTGLSMDEIAEL